MLKIKNYNDKGEIYIYGDIITDTDATWLKMLDDGTLGYEFPTKIREQLDELKGKPIDVHIASDGGDVSAGVAIYNMLSTHDNEVTVYVDSWAASIASFICFAGQKIVMPENTFLMIHNPKAGLAYGDSNYLRTIADWLDKIKTMLVDTYKKHSNNANIEELMDKETWLTAKECVEMFDNIELTDANAIEAVASLKSSFKNCPISNNNNSNNNNIKEKIIYVLTEAFSYEEKG